MTLFMLLEEQTGTMKFCRFDFPPHSGSYCLYHQSGEKYCFISNKWEEIPPMNYARASPAVAASNGKIYAIGGDQISEVNFYRAR